MTDEEYRANYDAVMAELGKLDINHPARVAFANLCQWGIDQTDKAELEN